jgi:hypothetical protein
LYLLGLLKTNVFFCILIYKNAVSFRIFLNNKILLEKKTLYIYSTKTVQLLIEKERRQEGKKKLLSIAPINICMYYF